MSDNPQKASSSPPAAFDLSKLRDELKCCVCLSLFEEPRNLPCGHNCCAACIQGLIAVADQPVHFIICPECRVEVRVPADGQFPTAFAIKSMVSHFKQAEAENPNEVKLEVTAKEHGEKIAQLGELVKKLFEKTEKLEMKVKLGEEKEQAAEYARLIAMPNVANLEGNYERKEMLNLLKHGNIIGPKLYIQRNQELDDTGLIQFIVDLLASAEKPEKMVGDVTIEPGAFCFFNWPQNVQLKLKGKKSNVDIKWNEASTNPRTFSDSNLAEYELANKDSRFQVLLYCAESSFNYWAKKFVYHRLD